MRGTAAGHDAARMGTERSMEEGAREFIDSVVVARPRHELYAFWRNFTNLPRFMENVQKVTEVDSLSSVWTVKSPNGESADWEFIVTDDEADRLIAWSTSGNTPVRYAGRVEFKDALGGTEVTATVRYAPPKGLVENLIAKLSGAPAAEGPLVQTRGDLLRFKEHMEGRL